MFKGKYRFSDRENFQIQNEEAEDFVALCQFVEEENRRCLKEKSTASVTIQAIDKKEHCLLEQKIALPFEEEVERVLFPLLEPSKSKRKVVKKEKPNKKGQQKPGTQPKKAENKVGHFLNVRLFKKILVGIVVVGFISGGIYGATKVWHFPRQKEVIKVEKESLEQLLEKEAYQEAIRVYPKNKVQIEDAIFQMLIAQKPENRKIKVLKDFQKSYATKQGQLDLAFLNAEYVSMIDLYEKDKTVFRKDDLRLSLIGYAYLKNGKISQAKELAEEVQDSALAKKIASYELYTQQLSEKEAKVKETKPTNESELKKYNQTLDEIYELKQKIKNL